MKIIIAKVNENLFAGDAISLHAKTTEGEITVLPNHEPFVANLAAGTVSIKTADGDKTFSVDQGVLEVSNNQATVLL